MNGGVAFGEYNADKYLSDVKGKRRMAGDVFQKTFGDKGWNKELTDMYKTPLTVNRDASLDYVAAQAKEKEEEKNQAELNAMYYGGSMG